MRNETRVEHEKYLAKIASLNGIKDPSKKFAVTNPIEQIMEDKIQESSEFLGKINIVGVTEQQGEKLGLSVGSTIAGTQDTDAGDRATQDPSTLDGHGYLCTQTNFDTHIGYAKLDLWAATKNFQERVRNMVLKRMALDRIMIGFNGASRAATSNRGVNPLLQDVNIGWFEKIRLNAPQQYIDEIVGASGVVNVGAAGDYKNLDSLVYDSVNNYIATHLQDDTELVVVLGRQLLADKYFPLIETHGSTPSENKALDTMISSKRVGGLQGVRVPYIPANSMAITRLDNLSIYFQKGSRRRTIVENAKRDRVEDYQSVNEAYVVEDYDGICLIDNIALV